MSGAFGDHLPEVAGAHAVAGFRRDGEGERRRTQHARALAGNGSGPAQRGPRDFGRLAHADEQHPLRRAGGGVEQQRLVALPLEVAARECPGQHAPRGPVELGERGGQVAPRGERHREQRGLDLGKALCADGAVHVKCSIMASPNAEVETGVAPERWRARS